MNWKDARRLAKRTYPALKPGRFTGVSLANHTAIITGEGVESVVVYNDDLMRLAGALLTADGGYVMVAKDHFDDLVARAEKKKP